MAVDGAIDELEQELESFKHARGVHPNDWAQVHLRLGCAYARRARFGGGEDASARAMVAAHTTAATHLHQSIEHFEMWVWS